METGIGEFWDNWIEESEEEKRHIEMMLDLIHKEVIDRDDRSESRAIQEKIPRLQSHRSCKGVDLYRGNNGNDRVRGFGED